MVGVRRRTHRVQRGMSLVHMKQRLMSQGKGEGWTMRHKHTLFPRRPVGKLVIIPKTGKILVLSGELPPCLAIDEKPK
jgi:hypothetical protein